LRVEIFIAQNQAAAVLARSLRRDRKSAGVPEVEKSSG
jgi:hypothetical protein